jgi:hypothetical protein
VLNDATVQGLGGQGQGLECATLGNRVGCALFRDRRLLLPLRSASTGRKGKTYDQYIGQAALVAKGPEA